MLRTALRTKLRAPSAHPRGFVSTVLLTKAWEQEPVSELKKEVRRRGLSQQGNKITLVARLKQDDERNSLAPPAPVSPRIPQQVRHASTAEVPGIPSTSEPPPLPKGFPKEFLRVRLPDVSQEDPEPPVQMPLLPDLWGASSPKIQPAFDTGNDPDAPKMVAVAGSSTHHGGGPTHSLSGSNEEYAELEESADTKYTNQSFWRDVADDLSLPASFKPSAPAKLAFDVAAKMETSGEKSYSRTLDSDEIRGLWVLFGLLAGSWVAAGVLALPSAKTVEEVVADVEEETKGH